MQKSVAIVYSCMCGCGHLLSKRRTLLEQTAEISGTGEQAGFLGSGERAAHAAVAHGGGELSHTLLTETWFSFRPCTKGREGAWPSVTIGPAGMLAIATDSWTRLSSAAALVCICRVAHGGLVGHRSGTPLGQGAALGHVWCACRWRSWASGVMAQLAVEGPVAPGPAKQSPCEDTRVRRWGGDRRAVGCG